MMLGWLSGIYMLKAVALVIMSNCMTREVMFISHEVLVLETCYQLQSLYYLKHAEVNLLNLKLQIYEEKGIKFQLCSVGGHNEHGLVEHVIRTLQDSLDGSG